MAFLSGHDLEAAHCASIHIQSELTHRATSDPCEPRKYSLLCVDKNGGTYDETKQQNEFGEQSAVFSTDDNGHYKLIFISCSKKFHWVN